MSTQAAEAVKATATPERPAAATTRDSAERTMISAMAVNALVSMDRSQILAAAGRFLARVAADPALVARRSAGLARELFDITFGRSDRTAEAGDKRFADPAFEKHPGYRRLM